MDLPLVKTVSKSLKGRTCSNLRNQFFHPCIPIASEEQRTSLSSFFPQPFCTTTSHHVNIISSTCLLGSRKRGAPPDLSSLSERLKWPSDHLSSIFSKEAMTTRQIHAFSGTNDIAACPTVLGILEIPPNYKYNVAQNPQYW